MASSKLSTCLENQHSLACDVDKRRSANYKPSTLGTTDFLESLGRDHVLEANSQKIERMKPKVKSMMADEKLEMSMLLKLIDDVQRLGLSSHFDQDIKCALNRVASNKGDLKLNFHATALMFRLLRQNGIWVSQDEFKQFKDEDGNFMQSLGKDIEGMLNLFEASYFAFEGEELLDQAKTFATKHLNDVAKTRNKSMVNYVNETLELPLRYRLPRLEARLFMEVHSGRRYDDVVDGRAVLLELGKLNFNMVQSMHRNELREMVKWWREIGLSNRLSFARDRLTEAVFWSASVAHKPEFSRCRKGLTKMATFITLIDDIYDVHGYMDELQTFTKAVERWDITAIDELPNYMKLTFLALYNTINEIGYEILKEKGHNCIPFLKKAWEEMCKAFLVEAKWHYNNQIPKFEDYINNAWVSSSGPLQLAHAYLLANPNFTQEGLDCLFNNHDLLRLPSIIFRLANDLATSEAEIQRGETTNAISCYAKDYGVSFEDARKHLKKLIDECWKGLNKIQASINSTPFSNEFVEIAINLARSAQCIYQHGDGCGSPDLIKKRVLSLIVDPLQ